jgi:aminoglycoside phosphotransferase (APT) family kinase protein
MQAAAASGVEIPRALTAWLEQALGDPGPFAATRLSGGNSNETLLLESPGARRVLRHPPPATIAPSAHAMDREHRVLSAVAGRGVPAPRALALCADTAVPGAPWLVMEHVEGVPLTTDLPASWRGRPGILEQIGGAAVDALVALHGVDWRDAGLDDFGRPEGFLERQVHRWRAQLERYRVRDLPLFDPVAEWLDAHRAPDAEPALLHGDFHLDNTLSVVEDDRVRVAAIIDWEMATVGDPLLDLGLLLAFWGDERPAFPAMPRVQGVSRAADAPSREALAARYAERSGRSVEHLDWYMALAFWKLAAIVEGAYAHFVRGRLDSRYARELEQDVPRLLAEAAAFCGIADERGS